MAQFRRVISDCLEDVKRIRACQFSLERFQFVLQNLNSFPLV